MGDDQMTFDGSTVEVDEDGIPLEPTHRRCGVCGELFARDDTVENWGQVMCKDCTTEPVAFAARCTIDGCDWHTANTGQEYRRGGIEQATQRDANTHVTDMSVTHDETHETEVIEVSPAVLERHSPTETIANEKGEGVGI